MEFSPNFYHIVGHKASVSKYKKIEKIPCILSHNSLKLKINNKQQYKTYKQFEAEQYIGQ
jgi:hypothetical protein